jgi:hypothetical protein
MSLVLIYLDNKISIEILPKTAGEEKKITTFLTLHLTILPDYPNELPSYEIDN